MNIPTTNNIWIISLVGGVIMFVYGFSKQQEFSELIDNYSAQNELLLYELTSTTKELTELLNILKEESAEIDKQIDNYNGKTDVSNLIETLLEYNESQTKEIELKRKSANKKLDLAQIEFDAKVDFYNRNWTLYFSLTMIGLLLAILGVYNLMKNQFYRDKLLYADYLTLKVKYPNCQSCGIKLENDRHFDGKSNFCSYCYSGEEFSIKNISLDDFKLLVREQMTLKGVKESEIRSHLKKMNGLARWSKGFSWEQ